MHNFGRLLDDDWFFIFNNNHLSALAEERTLPCYRNLLSIQMK